jgi:hypothetical protein
MKQKKPIMPDYDKLTAIQSTAELLTRLSGNEIIGSKMRVRAALEDLLYHLGYNCEAVLTLTRGGEA